MTEFTPAPIAPAFTLASLNADTASAAIAAATGSAPSSAPGKTGAPAESWLELQWDQLSHSLLHGLVVAPVKAIAKTPVGKTANDAADLASGNWVKDLLTGGADLAARVENEIVLGAIALAFISGGILWIASSQAPAIEEAAGRVAKVAAVAA